MWLAIDTATDRASVALGATAATALQEEVVGARRHAAALLPMVEALLRRGGATLNDVTGIALSDGPGSFTGLRVAAAVAKALVHTRGLPLWIAPSLMVRAAGVALGQESTDVGASRSSAGASGARTSSGAAPRGAASDGGVSDGTASGATIPGAGRSEGGLVLAVANALRGEVFAAAYRFRLDGVITELAPSVWHPEDLAGGGLRPTLVVGDIPEEAREVLEGWTGRSIIGPPAGAPHAAWLIDLVGRPGGAVRVPDVPAWEPVYGRPAEAQVRWEEAHGRPLPDPVGRAG